MSSVHLIAAVHKFCNRFFNSHEPYFGLVPVPMGWTPPLNTALKRARLSFL